MTTSPNNRKRRNRKTRRLLGTLVLAGILGCLPAAAEPDTPITPDAPDAPDLWRTIASLEFPVDTPVAFSEQRKTRLQRKPRTQIGKLWLSEDGSFVMSVVEPRNELRRLNGGTLSLTRGDKTRRLELDPNRGTHQLLLAIVDVLDGNIERLQTNFTIEAKPSQNSSWLVQLTPKGRALHNELSALTLRGTESQLQAVRAERGQSFQEITLLGERPANDLLSVPTP